MIGDLGARQDHRVHLVGPSRRDVSSDHPAAVVSHQREALQIELAQGSVEAVDMAPQR